MSSFSIEGIENLQRIMREFPEEGFRKPIVAGFKKAAVPVRKAMIDALPSNMKSLRKAIKAKALKGNPPALLVGVFARQGVYRNRRGIDWDPYQLALWHNYGTLDYRANRFHKFVRPVRKTKSADMAGIRPGLFIERAWERSKYNAQSTFEETVEIETDKWLEKNAYKG